MEGLLWCAGVVAVLVGLGAKGIAHSLSADGFSGVYCP